VIGLIAVVVVVSAAILDRFGDDSGSFTILPLPEIVSW